MLSPPHCIPQDHHRLCVDDHPKIPSPAVCPQERNQLRATSLAPRAHQESSADHRRNSNTSRPTRFPYVPLRSSSTSSSSTSSSSTGNLPTTRPTHRSQDRRRAVKSRSSGKKSLNFQWDV
ncbi:uncharacterized protein K489DRAFT_379050 [Dissoconium aciculare CBS 342.82]|uniref:Uncharacterized protein n=1 Tax=Dissoconium aciculare CBS 342.82 TaxID=1314786 RepID=A0A6J3M9V1_9PEZI|nr:uncharacterized protein K489DRAFT_379050 [Dissoconium aciculare CBS 342.82]KAF1824618.1 hypothetical protein K489DRAFT_379050 [Dissoconium aciculare CBS 342.82]